jgi:hypothetical protein
LSVLKIDDTMSEGCNDPASFGGRMMAVKSIQAQTQRLLEQMRRTHQQRGTLYKENYIALGKIMVAMFPNGLTLNTEEDFVRFDFLNHVIGKVTRFAQADLRHVDSVMDASVYGAMLAAFVTTHYTEPSVQPRRKRR